MSNKSVLILSVFVLLNFQAFGNTHFKVLKSSGNSLTIEYTPKINYKINNGIFDYDVEFGFIPEDKNLPALQSEILTIGVPSFENNIEIISSKFIEENGRINSPAYRKNKSVEFDKWIIKANQGISRSLRLQSFYLFPVLYSKGKIKQLKKLVFRITFNKNGNDFTELDDNLLKHSIINYNIAKHWGIKRKRQNKAVYNSVLASGVWYRTNITEEGIYKIDYNKLVSLGFNPETDDPRTIKIFNNGGMSQPELDEEPREDDLTENPILFFGDEDGKLNSNDFLLFYGHGTDFFYGDTLRNTIENYHHPFSQKNYYWITWGGSNGKRVNLISSLNTTDYVERTFTEKFIKHEKDEFNPNRSGRLFLGEQFNSSQRILTFTNDLDYYISGTSITYDLGLAVLSADGISMTVSENGNDFYSTFLYGYGNSDYVNGKYFSTTKTLENPAIANGRSVLKFSFGANTSTQNGALDYFTIRYKGELKLKNGFLNFFSEPATSPVNVKYIIENPNGNDFYVLKVDDFKNISQMQLQNENGKKFFIAEENYGHISKYVAFDLSGVKVPSFEKVENQNLHGDEANVKMIIIAPPEFSEEAEALAEYRSSQSPNPLSAKVFYTDKIYNEFSCGSENDPTAIRDFIMYAYKHWQVRPSYVILFGKGTYDYFDTEKAHNNFVPTYQSKYSPLHGVESYDTDDYFAYVDGNDTYMDLAVGRLSVETKDEAQSVVDKIIAYENNTDFSKWRRLATFVADDGKTSHVDDYSLHTRQCENISNLFPEYFDKNKIYLVLYPTEITGTGRRKPLVNQAIIDAFNDGTVLMHYHGHGNPEVWAHEKVFVNDVTIPQLENSNQPFVTVAACDFARCDDPLKMSGGELLVNKPSSGAIGVLASQRPVYPGQNSTFASYFYTALLTPSQYNITSRVGDAVFSAKVSYNVTNSKKFVLVGDPAVRLNIPAYLANIDSVNGNDLQNPVQIKALSSVKINGGLIDLNGYEGEAIVSVNDAKRYVTITEEGWNNMQVEFSGATLFRGRSAIENSTFATSFVVPKDISYENKNGKITVYFHNDETDGIGYTTNIIVGGIENRPNDGAGPEIEIAFDDFNSHGNLVNTDFTFLAKLSDDTGINTSAAGIGHTLEGIIDGDLENPIDFTQYFVGDIDAGGTSGEVKYNFYGFEPGTHTIKIKAWDVFNNPSEKETEFTVVEGDGLIVKNIVNYPNPFSESTYFTFQYNLDEPIDVQINIYTVYGRKIKEIKEYGLTDRFVKIYWDGRDEDGNSLANGTYLYKVIINSFSGKYSKSFLGKLAIIK